MAGSFARAYQKIFSDAPYYEEYNLEDILRDVVVAHLPNNKKAPSKDQCVFIVEAGEPHEIVGFGCAHGALAPTEPSIRRFLLKQENQLPFPLDRATMMSELGLLEEYRSFGLGKLLVLYRFLWARHHGYSHYVMRTADEGSKSAEMYMGLNANKAQFTQRVDSAVAGDAETQSKFRAYYYGDLPANLDELIDQRTQSVNQALSEKLGTKTQIIVQGV